MTEDEFGQLHFEEVSIRLNGEKTEYYVSDSRGYIMYVTAVEETVEEARRKVGAIAAKVSIPKSFYRNDIGLSFLEKDEALLKKWGYLV